MPSAATWLRSNCAPRRMHARRPVPLVLRFGSTPVRAAQFERKHQFGPRPSPGCAEQAPAANHQRRAQVPARTSSHHPTMLGHPDAHANPRLGIPADRHNASFPAAHLKSGPGVQPTAPTARSPGALVQNFRGVQAESMAPTSRLNDFRTLCNPTERCCRLPGHRQLQEEK